jgi:uncharacterized protein (TIGR02284 family)
VSFEQAEPELRERWNGQGRGASLDWASAKNAVRDAWLRLEERWKGSAQNREGQGAVQVEAKHTEHVRDTLNNLIEICKDGAMGFRLAAEKVQPVYASLFNQIAADRDAFAAELQDEVRILGGEPKNSGDATGALHRGWINIKSAVTSGDKAIIDECERGEDAAVEAYRKALEAAPPAAVYSLIARQYTKVKSAHDRVSAIKHSRH